MSKVGTCKLCRRDGRINNERICYRCYSKANSKKRYYKCKREKICNYCGKKVKSIKGHYNVRCETCLDLARTKKEEKIK